MVSSHPGVATPRQGPRTTGQYERAGTSVRKLCVGHAQAQKRSEDRRKAKKTKDEWGCPVIGHPSPPTLGRSDKGGAGSTSDGLAFSGVASAGPSA